MDFWRNLQHCKRGHFSTIWLTSLETNWWDLHEFYQMFRFVVIWNISVSFCLRAPGYGLTLWCALSLLVGAQYKCISYSYSYDVKLDKELKSLSNLISYTTIVTLYEVRAGVDTVGVVVRSFWQSWAWSTSMDGWGTRLWDLCAESLLRTRRERREDIRRVRGDRICGTTAATGVSSAWSSTDATLDLREVPSLALSSAARSLTRTLLPGAFFSVTNFCSLIRVLSVFNRYEFFFSASENRKHFQPSELVRYHARDSH